MMAITKQEMLDKIEERKTEANTKLTNLLANGDISSELDEAQLFGVLHAIAVTQPEVKKYIEDNY